MKKCTKCGALKTLSEFGKCNPKNPCGAFKDGLTYECRKCHNESRRTWAKTHRESTSRATSRYHQKHPEFRLWSEAKRRAKERGTPFEIIRNDVVIPALCPALGIPLARNAGKCGVGSPSLDAIIPELGYVRGNVAVISHKANTMKSNATIAELKSLVAWLEKESPQLAVAA